MESAILPPRQLRTPLFVAGGESYIAALDALFTLDEPCGTCIASTPPAIAALAPLRSGASEPPAILRSRLGGEQGDARVVTPPSRLRGLAPRPGEWITVDVSSRGARLSQVVLARTLFDSEMLFAYADLDRPVRRGREPEIAIGLWRSFARSWERFGAGLGNEGAELAAEIALGVVVRRYYITATLGNPVVMTLALATADPIVAEVAGRALLRLRRAVPDDRMIAPWEAPIVQRATELRLGVRTPDEIAIRSLWRGDPDRAESFASLVRQLADLLSVTLD